MDCYGGRADGNPFLTSLDPFQKTEYPATDDQPRSLLESKSWDQPGAAEADGSFTFEQRATKVDTRGRATSHPGATEPLPLQPFVPPPPAAKLCVKHHYFSLSGSEAGSVHAMSDWEKKLILSRLRKSAPVNAEEFQQRLSRAQRRNADRSINNLRYRAKEHDEEVAFAKEQQFLAEEERRDLIFFRHKNLLRLREVEKFITRAQSWYRIIVSHVFLTALIHERRVQEALETFSHLMGPMVRRHLSLKHKRREAKELTRSQLNNIPFPHPQVIQSMYGTFFDGWPPLLLEKLVVNATPTYLKKGSYLMHEGDIGRVMFMITTGTVSIILRKKGKDKRRTKDNSNGVFQITAPCYVGEFALVCKEPRSASIYCETDIGFWAVRPDDYEEVARHLSPEVASKQREATDVRRRQNLQKFFPLNVDFLRKFPYFEHFSNRSLEKIISCVEPLVLHDGDFLFQSGEMDSSVYFVQDGIAMKRDNAGNESKVTMGSCVGMFECSCGVNERKQYSIVSFNYCDVWRMKRETLVDVGMSEPIALLHCRKSAKADRARQIERKPKAPVFLRNDPYLSFCLPSIYISKLYDLSTPIVYLNGEKVTIMGQTVNALVILLSGALDVTVASNGEQESFRINVADCQARYDTSAPISAAAATESHMAPSHGQATTGGEDGALGATKRFTRSVFAAPINKHSSKDDGRTTTECCAAAITAVLGAYEFAASVPQYTYTISSFGLTEALVVDRSKLESILPPALRSVISGNVKARDLVRRAYKRRSLNTLSQDNVDSFAHIYKVLRDGERDTGKRRRENAM